MNNNDILVKEIDLIQACINRMAQNSFFVKGWAISLTTVVLALLPEKIDAVLLCTVVFIETLCFWYLDAFFLRCERLYRWKYEWVIANRKNNDSHYYDLNPYNKSMWLSEGTNKKTVPCIICIMFTKTLMPIYIPLITLSLLYLLTKVL